MMSKDHAVLKSTHTDITYCIDRPYREQGSLARQFQSFGVYYQVTVTFAIVASVPGDFNITLCFREANSSFADSPTFCPLGMTTSANTRFPAETLELGEGGDLLPGPYPVINAGMLTIGAGVSVFLGVVRIDGVNGFTEEVASNTQFYSHC